MNQKYIGSQYIGSPAQRNLKAWDELQETQQIANTSKVSSSNFNPLTMQTSNPSAARGGQRNNKFYLSGGRMEDKIEEGLREGTIEMFSGQKCPNQKYIFIKETKVSDSGKREKREIAEYSEKLQKKEKRIEELQRILASYHVKISELDLALKDSMGVTTDLTSLTPTHSRWGPRNEQRWLIEEVRTLENSLKQLQKQNQILRANPVIIYRDRPIYLQKQVPRYFKPVINYLSPATPLPQQRSELGAIDQTALKQQNEIKELTQKLSIICQKHQELVKECSQLMKAQKMKSSVSFLDDQERDPTSMSWRTHDNSCSGIDLYGDKIAGLELQNSRLKDRVHRLSKKG